MYVKENPTARQRNRLRINMTDQTVPSQNNSTTSEPKPNDKEYNFRQLEQKYQRQLEQERAARLEAEKAVQEVQSRKQVPEEDDDSEPYVDHKKLTKKLADFEKNMEKKIDQRAEEKARSMMDQQKRESWMRANPDFYDVLQHAEKFAQQDPELAEAILEMPDTFERQKLVYKNIKAFGVHKPKVPESSIQQKVDANRKSPYYQPAGIAPSPYAGQSDFSPSGQKNAYDQMQKLKSQLRI